MQNIRFSLHNGLISKQVVRILFLKSVCTQDAPTWLHAGKVKYCREPVHCVHQSEEKSLFISQRFPEACFKKSLNLSDTTETVVITKRVKILTSFNFNDYLSIIQLISKNTQLKIVSDFVLCLTLLL